MASTNLEPKERFVFLLFFDSPYPRESGERKVQVFKLRKDAEKVADIMSDCGLGPYIEEVRLH